MKVSVASKVAAAIAAAGVLTLCAGSASAQGGGRRSAQAGQSAQRGQAAASCPAGSGTATGGTTSTGTTSGTTTAGNSVATLLAGSSASTMAAQRTANANAAQGSRAFSIQRLSANQVGVAWSGNAGNAQVAYIGLLDSSGQVLSQQAVTQAPVQANLPLNSSARYIGIRLVYPNGSSVTSYAPLQ